MSHRSPENTKIDRPMAIIGCRATGKVLFKSKSRAKHAASVILKNHGTKRRAYRCPHCKQWHLTSMDVNDVAAAKDREARNRNARDASTRRQ